MSKILREISLLILVNFLVTGAAFAQFYTVTNADDAGFGSLRNAITTANATPNAEGPDHIQFDIPGVGPHTIQVLTPLPIITDPVIIDGYTQSGAIPDTNGPGQPFNGVLQIVLDGSLAPTGSGLQVNGNNSTIQGLVINQFYLDGVTFWTAESTGNLLTECFIGTDVTGTIPLGNGRNLGGESLGVRIGLGASNNTVQRNLISGNVQSGLSLDNGGNNNLIIDNAIGTDPTGTFAVPNGAAGIVVQSGAFGNTIQSNLVSGNTQHGVTSFGGANKNTYDDNTIGTNLSGTAAIPNLFHGMNIFGDNGDVITNNLISGNLADGIVSGEAGLVITDNLIGTDISGTQVIGNGQGIWLFDGGHTIVDNVISGNSRGIVLQTVVATNVTIRNNAIGTDATGLLKLANANEGIFLILGTLSAVLVEQNLVAFNGGEGIKIQGDNISGVTITQNAIYDNVRQGIDLLLDDGLGNISSGGLTPNDAGDGDIGPNILQNFPDLLDVEIDGSGDLVVDFLVDSVPGNSTYPMDIEFFIADADNEEGKYYIGTAPYLVDEAGEPKKVVLGNAVGLGVAGDSRFVATATDAAGNTSEFSLPAGLVTTDVLALEALYNSTGGDNWTNNTNWLSAEPLENWFGVSAVGGQVTELNLPSNNLKGLLPAELDNLESLTSLDLFGNQLTGAIPAEPGNLASLTFLDLSGNQLTGAIPAELGDLASLTFLGLSDNQLTGAIPPELGNLTSLTYLGLEVNQLTGAIPAELGNLTSLTILSLGPNQLSGAIPAELGNLTSLTYLSLRLNQLTGAIPADLGNLTSLTFLGLNNNQVTGAIPAELGNLAGLNTLWLNGNQLTGAIPAELGNLKSLAELRLNDNRLDGAVPNSFANLSDLERLTVSQNELIDLPDLSDLANLTFFQVQNNRFTFDDLEPNIGIPGFVYSPQLMFGTESTESILEGVSLTLSLSVGGSVNSYQWYKDGLPIPGANSEQYTITSAIQGDAGSYTLKVTNAIVPGLTLQSHPIVVTVSVVAEDDLQALEALYNSTGGLDWTINTNWLSAEPLENWFGVSAVGGQVTELNLQSNNLTGSLPAELGNLESLTSLDLFGNLLTGAIPPELGNLTNLTLLSLAGFLSTDLNGNLLTGAIPPELGNLASLTFLGLQGNLLTGAIPAELGNLASLTFLGLNHNQLTGTIPAELGNLSNLTGLHLCCNQLSGAIRAELGSLASLTFLGLSVNQLTGTIPAELGNLSNLTGLHLCCNRLSGAIPPELSNLASLTTLSLSGNQLTGAIPTELGNLAGLNFLDVAFNQLTGAIPTELGDLTRLNSLWLHGNQLTGAIPAELGDLPSLTTLRINDNQLTGSIPAELGNLASLTFLDLQGNQLTGAIPSELGNLSSLFNLELQVNQLDGPVPNSFANLSDLETLNVSQNELIDLPDLSDLANLTSFQVQDNRFTFEDLEANAGIAGAVYVPQARFGTASMESVNTGDPLTLAFVVSGTANQYQWLRDDSPISGANSNEYSKSSATLSDAGVYSLEVTNSLVPGLTLQSESVTVIVNEIIIDVTDPTMIDASAGSDIPVSATLPDNYQPEQREVCFRRSAEPVYQCIALVRVGALDSALIPADYVTDRGVDYYFRFTRGGNVLTIPEEGAGNPFHLRVGVSEAQADGSFLPSTYRMVSVPLELENPQIEAVLDDYGPYDPTRWRIFRWDSNSQALVEHPSTSDSFTPCIAFWLITLDGSGFSVDGGTSLDPFSECGTSSFSFKPGWNQFGIPRAYPIDWEDVLKFGELDDPVNFNATIEGSDPYTYNVSTLVPWDGYWVNNPGTQDVLVTFPSVESSGTPGKQSSALAFLANSEYAIQLRASIPDRELVDEHNYLGFSKNASNGKDRMDFAEAPGIGSFVRLSLTEDDVRLAGNFKEYDLDGAAWQFEVTAEFPDGIPLNGEHVRVQILELLPRLQSQEIYVINEDEDRRVRPTAESFSVSLTRERPIVHYRIIVGTPEYAAEISDGVSLVPQSFALEQNYPNPFNPTTQIRYQLSESSHVVLEIFNSLGQRINVLVDSDQGVGWYEVTWDSRDSSGQRAASGVYFYRLRAEDVMLSKPMLLIK